MKSCETKYTKNYLLYIDIQKVYRLNYKFEDPPKVASHLPACEGVFDAFWLMLLSQSPSGGLSKVKDGANMKSSPSTLDS